MPAPSAAYLTDMTRTPKPASATEHLPARWLDISADPAAIHARTASAMRRHLYRAHGPVVDGIARYRYMSPGSEFLSDMASFGLILNILGRPDSFAELAAWTEPSPDGTRLTISLAHGIFHAKRVRAMIVEIIEEFRVDGSLVNASPPFSGLDLPLDSPGRPSRMWRGRAGTAPTS
jgi:hypothetical protein